MLNTACISHKTDRCSWLTEPVGKVSFIFIAFHVRRYGVKATGKSPGILESCRSENAPNVSGRTENSFQSEAL